MWENGDRAPPIVTLGTQMEVNDLLLFPTALTLEIVPKLLGFDTFFSHMNRIHNSGKHNFFKIHFNIFSHLSLGIPSCLFLFRFRGLELISPSVF